MLPLLPLLFLSSIFGGSCGLWWYHGLDQKKKDRANALTISYARTLFDKAVDELSHAESKTVHDLVKRQFLN